MATCTTSLYHAYSLDMNIHAVNDRNVGCINTYLLLAEFEGHTVSYRIIFSPSNYAQVHSVQAINQKWTKNKDLYL